MKVIFRKSLESPQWRDDRMGWQQQRHPLYPYFYYDDYLNGLETILRNNFKSVKITKYPDLMLFHFEDSADTAFFMVWSNGGIDI